MNREGLFAHLAGLQSWAGLDHDLKTALAVILQGYRDDPLGFCSWAFPWGVPGTRLAHSHLEKWQIQVLDAIGTMRRDGDPSGVCRAAISSGHGVGKSAIISMLVIWFISTHPTPQIVVTANTQQQLLNKTWREIEVWLKMSLVSGMFQHTKTRLFNREAPSRWFASAVPWSETNAEAFAGTHEKHVLLVFDEASKISKNIWETAYGALTQTADDPEASMPVMVACGNPTQNSGVFYDVTWGKDKKRWYTINVDSREVSLTNKELIKEWADDYGEDSDFFRVRVKGLPPQQSSLQFIAGWMVRQAMDREIPIDELSPMSPKIMGIDVARHGDDHSVFLWRKAKKVLGFKKFQVPDLMHLAQMAASAIEDSQPDAVFIDAQGMGAGVYDRLVQLGFGEVVIPVYWGKSAQDDKVYVNNRVECWARMRDWLEGADIPNDNSLMEELVAPEFGYERKSERIRLETKTEMRKRGIDSPDVADALALTFAEIVPETRGLSARKTEPDYV